MKVLIITGGDLKINNIINYKEFDLIIAVDGALHFTKKHNIKVDVAVGDFDTVEVDILKFYRMKGIEILEYSTDKNYSDTHLAIITAIKRGGKSIVLMGAIGSRLDHTLANIQVLMLPLEKGIPCKIINEYNCIRIMNKRLILNNDFGKYISLIPLTSKVTGITTKGLKYPLEQKALIIGESIGISNEIINKKAIIEIKEGILIVIQSKD